MPKSKVRAKRRKALKGRSPYDADSVYMGANDYGSASAFVDTLVMSSLARYGVEVQREGAAYRERIFIVGSELSNVGEVVVDAIFDAGGVSRKVVDDVPVAVIAHKVAKSLFNGCRSGGEADHRSSFEVFWDGLQLTCDGIVDYLRDGRVSADKLERVRLSFDFEHRLTCEGLDAWKRVLERCAATGFPVR